MWSLPRVTEGKLLARASCKHPTIPGLVLPRVTDSGRLTESSRSTDFMYQRPKTSFQHQADFNKGYDLKHRQI